MHLPGWPQIWQTQVGGERFIILGGAGDGEVPMTSFFIVSLFGNFSSPLTDKMTGFSFFPAKIDHVTCSAQFGASWPWKTAK